MTDEEWDDILHIIRFGLTPAQRAELPVGVGTWLMPTQMAMDRITAEAQRGGSRGG